MQQNATFPHKKSKLFSFPYLTLFINVPNPQTVAGDATVREFPFFGGVGCRDC